MPEAIDYPLSRFFRPTSIAVIGASRNEQSMSGRVIKNLCIKGYTGKIYPVNPKYPEVMGFKAYPDVREIKEPVDLAFIALPARSVPEALEQCAAAGVSFVIVISSGFAEAGGEGGRLQEYITDFARRTGIRVLGPNCQGMVNLWDKVAVSFSGALEYEALPGSIGLVAQSGALGHAIFSVAQEKGLGLAYLVTTGNEADLSTIDFLEYMLADERVKVIIGYIEGFKQAPRLFTLGKESLRKKKPIILFKVGRSEVGQRAVSSHTAALAGSDQLYTALFEQAGMIKTSDLEEMLDAAYLFSLLDFLPQGDRVGIFTTSGGTGVVLADACADFGLSVPELKPETRKELEEILPTFGSARNPVDATGQVINNPEIFTRALKLVANDPGIDVLIIGMGMAVGEVAFERAKSLQETVSTFGKPVVVTWVAGETLAGPGLKVLREAKIPVYQNPARCIRALSTVIKYQAKVQKEQKLQVAEKKAPFPQAQLAEVKQLLMGRKVLSEYEAKKVLAPLGFPVAREIKATSASEAVEAAYALGYPVALKILSPQILHKTEHGGVKLNLRSKEEVAQAFLEMIQNVKVSFPEAEIEGVLVQEMLTGGVEVIVGSAPDPQLGPVVMFGLGGIFVELLRDVAFCFPPFSKEEALEMVNKTTAAKVLKGVRGKPPGDLEALVDLISRFSYLVAEMGPELEVDLNPVFVFPQGQGVKIADALIVNRETLRYNF